MARLARSLGRGLGIAGAAVLLAIPFIAPAQEGGADDAALVTDAEVTTVDGSGTDDQFEVDAPAGSEPERVVPDVGSEASGGVDVGSARAGPSWWTDGPHDGQGRPPWAGGPGGNGPPPWAGTGATDRPDGAGPPWFDGEREEPGRPPWAGGPRHSAPGATTDGWRPGEGRPPWAGADDRADDRADD